VGPPTKVASRKPRSLEPFHTDPIASRHRGPLCDYMGVSPLPVLGATAADGTFLAVVRSASAEERDFSDLRRRRYASIQGVRTLPINLDEERSLVMKDARLSAEQRAALLDQEHRDHFR
jgi:hypothetical protein